MKHNVMLTMVSLLSILLMTFHLTDDILRQGGMSQRGFLSSVLILVVWLYGTLMLAERRLGYVIILLGSLLGSGMPVIHTMGVGITKSHGALSVWILLAVGVTSVFSVILSVRGLWSLRRGQPRTA